tara:strand:+ start:117 stop:311 length:195 start_codon:yes stop_codon:yes gene_type:complete
MFIILTRFGGDLTMVKTKSFKNHKACKNFIANLTIRFKRRFKHLALYFVIGTKGDNIKYYQVKL